MIDQLMAFSIKNKLVVIFFVFGLIGWGTYSLSKIPIDAVPDITNNQVQIITQAPTLAAQEVEQFITFPVEISMSNLPDVVEIRSISRFGISVITVVFEEDVDLYLARQLISEQLKVAESEIPKGFGKPELAPITTGLGEVYQYILHTTPEYDSVYSAMDLRTINDWIVKRQLAGTKGVIEVSGWGGFLKQYEVSVNPEKLRSMNLTVAQVFEAIEKNNENTGGSYIEKQYNTYFIRGEGLVKSKSDIEKIVVKTVDNIPVLIRDIAEVKFGSSPRYGAVTWNGKGEVVSGQALMLKGENSYEVVQAVKERIEVIKKSLPEGVILEPFIERSGLIDRAIGTVTTNLVEGGLIVIFILVLLLGNLRGGLIVASVIPLSMLFALSLMNVFGVSANLMSLGAIDFGLIVDGAVIIVESIVHRLFMKYKNQKLTAEEMDEHVRESSVKIRSSAAFGEIIILIVYLPILALVGIEGKMFRPMAQTVSFAILGALILSLTYVPMMCALFLKKEVKEKVTIADKIIGFLQKRYAPVIQLALRKRYSIVLISLLLFGASLFTFSRMGGEFIPTLEEGDFALHQILPPGSSLAQGVEVSGKIQKVLMEKFPEVDHMVTKIGTAEVPTDPMPIEVGDIMVKMKPKSEWRHPTKEEMFEAMEKELAIIPGVGYEFTQPIQMRFNELISGVREDIAIKIYGEDLGILFQKGKQAEGLLTQIQGVGDVKVEQIVGLPQMLISYDRNKVAKYGVNIKDLNTIVRTAFAGEKAGVIFEGEKRFDLVVRLGEKYRQNIDDIRELYVPLPNGSQIPLREVANIDFKEAPMQISRENTKRRITIGVNARNRDIESLVNEISEKLDTQLGLPAGYFIEYGGQFENLMEAKKRLYVAVPIALLLILTLLFFTFKSIPQALLIFTAIPLSAIGGIYALWLRDMPFSISAGVGFIALFGVAVLNGIVLISYLNQLKKEGVTDVYARILEGTRVRLRPVIMTASVAALGFLPMALSTSAGGEVQKPLATVVIGGLISATLLTLIILPVLYSFLEKMPKAKKGNSLATILVVMSIALSGTSIAQDKVLSIEEAVELAIKNHPMMQSASFEIQQQEALKKSAFDLGKTDFQYSRGQMNSSAIDYQWQISQKIKFPTTYMSQANLQKEKVALSEVERDRKRNVLERQVRSRYMELKYAQSQVRLLEKLLSDFEAFSIVAEKRLKAGETNLLEAITAKAKKRSVQLQLEQARADEVIALTQLQKLTGSTTSIQIESSELSQLLVNWSDIAIQENPALRYQEQAIKVSGKLNQLQKMNYLPDLSIGYFNQQIDGETGFSGMRFGVAVPILFWGQKGRVDAAKLEVEKAKSTQQEVALMMSSALKTRVQELKKYNNALNYYTHEGKQLALQLETTSQKAYKAGEIGYVEYLTLKEEAVKIRLDYLEKLNQYNQTALMIHFLTGKYN